MSLNEGQREMAETLEGIVCVDAGPGTGKTHTITQRYINVIRRGVSPGSILMVTFTRNSAAEMRDRIRRDLTSEARAMDPSDPMRPFMQESCDSIRTSTFDAYCLRVLLSAPDEINEFFGFEEQLSRGARLVENDTLNKDAFRRFYSEFSKRHGRLYAGENDIPAIMATRVDDVFDIITKLMSDGIIPVKGFEWFADGEKRLLGDMECASDILRNRNDGKLARFDKKYTVSPDAPSSPLSEEEIASVAYEDRSRLIEFIWYVYYEYIRDSVRANRLTFSLVKILSFAVLYQSQYARDVNSADYLMVDEFQDTDEIQLKICLMLLNKGNLCVVGDWKQGIYGFRNASVDNILRFRDKIISFCRRLGSRVRFDPDDVEFRDIKLEVNYRSTDAILEPSFEALYAKGTKDDVVNIDDSSVVRLTPFKESESEPNSDKYLRYTSFTHCMFDSKDSEYEGIADLITEYMYSGDCMVVEKDGTVRKPGFGDFGVLFRNTSQCNAFYETAMRRRIPVFLQGDLEIMSSEPGKVALAWLRFVSNIDDKRAVTTLLDYEGYGMPEIEAMYRDANEIDENGRPMGLSRVLPRRMLEQRAFLKRKTRRPNDLLTSIFAYHNLGYGDGYEDIVQAIINVLSNSFDGSLITISDLIHLIEEDIEKETRYDVDAVLGRSAVTIQTIHKSKGLEYPFVIVGGINRGSLPVQSRSTGVLSFDDVFGIRCSRESIRSDDGMEGVLDSWRYRVIQNSRSSNYDEERRLLFVAMTRAKQYLCITASNPSRFFAHVAAGDDHTPRRCDVPYEDRTDAVSETPEIPVYSRRRRNIAVHDIMTYKTGADSGKGLEYGNLVHTAAQEMLLGKPFDASLPEMERIHRIIEGLGQTVRTLSEYPCALPVGDVTLRGVIDLYAEYEDRIEIHDYKTDTDTRNMDAYTTQLSVYARSVEQATGKPVSCIADFVSLGQSFEIEPLSMEEIEAMVEESLSDTVEI